MNVQENETNISIVIETYKSCKSARKTAKLYNMKRNVVIHILQYYSAKVETETKAEMESASKPSVPERIIKPRVVSAFMPTTEPALTSASKPVRKVIYEKVPTDTEKHSADTSAFFRLCNSLDKR